jgi:[ribosomal protein S5]-alanine N-acetyltransferase
MQFSTQRLLLRDFAPDDGPAVHAFDADPELRRYRGGGRASEADTRAFIQRTQQWLQAEPRPIYAFALLLQEHAQMIGIIGLTTTQPELGEAELWYRLSRIQWNQGYTTDAARAMVSFGFRDLHLHRIAALCHPDNIGSWRVMEKIGMCYEGRLRENAPKGDGTWRDSLLYAMIDHDWKGAHQQERAL